MDYVDLFLDLKKQVTENACLITDHYLTLCVTIHHKGCTQAMDTNSNQGERTVVRDVTASLPNS